MDLFLMAPLQLENLLPYNVQYRIYDKDTDQNWRSYLRAGGVMPIHSIELSHLVLLNIEINDTGSKALLRRPVKLIVSLVALKASDFSIINTDGHSDFDVENRLTLEDTRGRKLNLKLSYVCVLLLLCQVISGDANISPVDYQMQVVQSRSRFIRPT
jgi:vacuolar protein sorting-associated protein 13A/C